MRVEEMKKDREKIKNLLGVSRWSHRCQRVQKILEDYERGDVWIDRTSDFHYAERKTRPKDVVFKNIGCDTGKVKYYLYLAVRPEKSNKEG